MIRVARLDRVLRTAKARARFQVERHGVLHAITSAAVIREALELRVGFRRRKSTRRCAVIDYLPHSMSVLARGLPTVPRLAAIARVPSRGAMRAARAVRA